MLRLAGIETESIVDGPGIRTVLFCQGCYRRCEGCHNPETWPVEGGKEISTDEIVTLIHSDPLCTGITYSGGEPFLQAKDLIPLTKILKDEGYEVAVYSGYRFEELLMGTCDQLELLSYIDVLIDGPFDLKQRSLDLKFRGSRNQRILNVQEGLRKGEAVYEESRRWK